MLLKRNYIPSIHADAVAPTVALATMVAPVLPRMALRMDVAAAMAADAIDRSRKNNRDARCVCPCMSSIS